MNSGLEPRGTVTPLAETPVDTGASVATPAPPDAVSSRTPAWSAERASSPEQLTIDRFPEWDGRIPVPYGVIPFR